MLSTYSRNRALDHLLNGVFASLHETDPGDFGGKELRGGSPEYTRQPVFFGSAREGSASSDSLPIFNVPAGATIRYAGFWDRDGNFLWGSELEAPETFGAQGTYTLNSATLALSP